MEKSVLLKGRTSRPMENGTYGKWKEEGKEKREEGETEEKKLLSLLLT